MKYHFTSESEALTETLHLLPMSCTQVKSNHFKRLQKISLLGFLSLSRALLKMNDRRHSLRALKTNLLAQFNSRANHLEKAFYEKATLTEFSKLHSQNIA